MHFLKIIIVKRELMRFIIYVDTAYCAHKLRINARFTKKMCNATYRAQPRNFVPKFKKYIDKIYALCNSQIFKN